MAMLALAAAAQPAGDWADWPWLRPIVLQPADAPRLVSVPLPPPVYRHARPGLADLRVVDEAGREVPFLLHTPRGVHRQEWRAVRLLEASFLPGQFTQSVFDTGAPVEPHNSIELAIAETDFFTWVEVAASNDAVTWRILSERLPLYRFTAEGHRGSQVLNYAPSNSRYLRLRLLKGDAALTVTGARASQEIIEEPERVALEAHLTTPDDFPERHTGWRADFGAGAPPVSEAIFTAAEAEFHRPVRITASDNGESWRQIGSGEIYRLRRPAGVTENLRVAFSETQARYIRVEVLNRNDPPLASLAVEFRGVPRRVVFRQEPGRSYRLLYGYEKAPQPEYELARLVTAQEIAAAAPGALADEVPMPGHPRPPPPKPWTERHPVVLWSALGLAVVVLIWLATRSMRTA